jgi:hypothetical protein
MIEWVHNYILTYVKKQGYNWTKITGTNVPKSVETAQGGKVNTVESTSAN